MNTLTIELCTQEIPYRCIDINPAKINHITPYSYPWQTEIKMYDGKNHLVVNRLHRPLTTSGQNHRTLKSIQDLLGHVRVESTRMEREI